MAQLCSEQGLTALRFTPQGDLGGCNLDSLQMNPEWEIHARAAKDWSSKAELVQRTPAPLKNTDGTSPPPLDVLTPDLTAQ